MFLLEGLELTSIQEQQRALWQEAATFRQCRRQQRASMVKTEAHKQTAGAQDTKRAWINACMSRLRQQTFRSLGLRNYRLFFTGQVISRAGMWVQIIAENWLVVQLGGSGLMLGITTALQFAPLLLLSLYGGALVDRWNTRTVLLVTQSA